MPTWSFLTCPYDFPACVTGTLPAGQQPAYWGLCGFHQSSPSSSLQTITCPLHPPAKKLSPKPSKIRCSKAKQMHILEAQHGGGLTVPEQLRTQARREATQRPFPRLASPLSAFAHVRSLPFAAHQPLPLLGWRLRLQRFHSSALRQRGWGSGQGGGPAGPPPSCAPSSASAAPTAGPLRRASCCPPSSARAPSGAHASHFLVLVSQPRGGAA